MNCRHRTIRQQACHNEGRKITYQSGNCIVTRKYTVIGLYEAIVSCIVVKKVVEKMLLTKQIHNDNALHNLKESGKNIQPEFIKEPLRTKMQTSA